MTSEDPSTENVRPLLLAGNSVFVMDHSRATTTIFVSLYGPKLLLPAHLCPL